MSRFTKVFSAAILASTALTATTASAQTAPAAAEAEAAAEATDAGNDIIVTGTRATGQQAANAAAPVTLLSEAAMSKVGQPNLNQVITQLVPSFQAQTQGTDMASFSLSARLRGLSPNHTLVMVNGKRRHGSAILQVIASAFQGSAAPSIDLVPPDAVQRIEVLQEGAAAQYGSDAIAGVINIILKSNDAGGTAKITAGQYYDGEGDTLSVSANLGFKLGDNGFINLTGFHRYTDYTFVGDDQITVHNIDGSNVNTSSTAGFQSVYSKLKLANINGGQPRSHLTVGFLNAGYDFGAVQFYAFGDVSQRVGWAKQGYRPPNRVCSGATPSTCFADTGNTGFVPLQKVYQDEFSGTAGLKGETSGWSWDLSAEYGKDHNTIYTTNSVNRTMWLKLGYSPTDFFDGTFDTTQFVANLDIKKDIDIGFAEPLTFAFGGEYRRETYAIGQGDTASTYAEGGQSFPGFAASDAGKYSRHAQAVYVNLIAKPVEAWTVDVAGRYEHFSDFGDTVIGKLTTRYDFSDAFALRGTVSSGFRAPTMAESYYSATNVSPTSATVQLPPNSAAAALLGFKSLKPEKSFNISGGMVLRPIPRLVATLDAYYIKVNDRIAGTSTIYALRNGVKQSTYDAVMAAIASRGVTLDSAVTTVGVATFTNGVDTRTFGIDFSAKYPIDLGAANLDLGFSANYNDTKVTKNKLGTALFSKIAVSNLETAQPKYKLQLSALYTLGRFSANLRQSYQGRSMVLVTPSVSTANVYEGIVKATPLTDLELGYDLTDSISFAIGANNLFNKKPEIPALLTGADAALVTPGVSPYVNGTTTVNSPYGNGTYGTNGGFYYARLSFKF